MKTQKSFFEQNGGTYTKVGDVLLPDLAIGEAKQRLLGKYGRMELLVLQMTKQEGVTEALKAANQMAWVAHMNNIRSRAEEIVLHELVYTEEAEDADT